MPGLLAIGLGVAWTSFGSAKLLDPARAAALPPWLGGSATAVAWSVAVVETVIGGVLLVGLTRVRSVALVVGTGMLAVFGVMGVASPAQRCTCAGRLATMSPLVHTLVVATMLAASAACLRSTAWPAALPATSHVAPWRWGLLLLVLLAVGWATSAGRSMDLVPNEVVPAVVERPTYAPPELATGRPGATPPAPDGASGAPPEGPAARDEILGVVVDPHGSGVEGCTVFAATGERPARPVRTTTSADGQFALDTDTVTRIVVACAGWRVSDFDPATVDQDHRGLVLKMDGGLTISGRVFDETGAPVPGVWVQARGRDGAGWGWAPRASPPPGNLPEIAEAQTDAAGAFAVRGLTSGNFEILAWKADYGLARHGPGRGEAVAAGTQDVALVLRRRFRIRIDLVDEEGEPAWGAHCSIGLDPRSPWHVLADPHEPALDSIPQGAPYHVVRRDVVWASTAASSTAGSVPVSAACQGAGWVPRTVEVQPRPVAAAEAAPVRVVLRGTPMRERARVTFRLDGLPRATGRAMAWISHPGSPLGGSLLPLDFTDGDSQEVALPAGDYWFRMESGQGSFLSWHRPSGRATASLSVGPREVVTVRVPARGGRVLLAPTDESGDPIEQFFVFASAGWDVQFSTEEMSFPLTWDTVDTVRGRVVWLAPGTHRVTLRRHGGGKVDSVVAVPGDGSIQVLAPVLPRSP